MPAHRMYCWLESPVNAASPAIPLSAAVRHSVQPATDAILHELQHPGFTFRKKISPDEPAVWGAITNIRFHSKRADKLTSVARTPLYVPAPLPRLFHPKSHRRIDPNNSQRRQKNRSRGDNGNDDGNRRESQWVIVSDAVEFTRQNPQRHERERPVQRSGQSQ